MHLRLIGAYTGEQFVYSMEVNTAADEISKEIGQKQSREE